MKIETIPEVPKVESSPSIKLSRGMKGNYGWEIKILELNVEKLNKLNEEMIKKFGEEYEKD